MNRTTNQANTKQRKVENHTNGKLTVSPRESVRLTGFGINQTYELLKAGKMPSIQFDKKYHIPIAALEKWLENCGEFKRWSISTRRKTAR
jgi:hypothetical protein